MGAQPAIGEAQQASKETLEDKKNNIINGGFSPDETHSTESGAQHAGISLGREGEAASGHVGKDPLATFAAGNKNLVDMLRGEQKDRLVRLDNAAAAQGKERTPAPDTAEPAAPRTIIRRKKDGGQ